MQGAALVAQGSVERILAHLIEGDLAVGRGTLVAQARQHLAHRGDGLADPSGAVDDPPVCAGEDQVGVLPHEFADDGLAGAVAQLVQVLDLDLQDAVGLGLTNLVDASADQVLAHQHAQVEGLQRAVLFNVRQVGARAACAGGQQQLVVCAAVAHGEDQLVALRLNDAVDASAAERVVEFAGDQAQRESVQGHGCSPSI